MLLALIIAANIFPQTGVGVAASVDDLWDTRDTIQELVQGTGQTAILGICLCRNAPYGKHTIYYAFGLQGRKEDIRKKIEEKAESCGGCDANGIFFIRIRGKDCE